MKLNEKIKLGLEKHFEDVKALADAITAHPEIGGEEEFAQATYREFFEKRGYTFEENLGDVPYAFRVSKPSKHGRKAVLMAEYDALPEIGHACGHSISGGISALAFLALQEVADELSFDVHLMGTPAEEIPGGKVALVRAGCFDDYLFAAMVHLSSHSSISANALAITDRRIRFEGKSSHASANPQEGINALNAIRLTMDALDMWRPHFPEGGQMHGVVTKGGILPSIIPDEAEFSYYFRARTMEDLDWLCELAEEVAEGVAKATRTKVHIQQDYETYADISNLPIKLKLMEEIYRTLEEPLEPWEKNLGSTDAGNTDYITPTFHPLMRVPGAEKLQVHDRAFAEAMTSPGAYEALKKGAIVMALLFQEMGTDEDLLQSIIKEHHEYRGIEK